MAESLGNGCYIFGIFDGHGNSVVSNKVAHILPKMIKEEIKSRNIVPGEGHSIESKIADLDWVELINTIFEKIDKVQRVCYEVKFIFKKLRLKLEQIWIIKKKLG